MDLVCKKFTLGGRISLKEFTGPVLVDGEALYLTPLVANAGGLAHGLLGGTAAWTASDWISDRILGSVVLPISTTLGELPEERRQATEHWQRIDPQTRIIILPKASVRGVRMSRIAGWTVEVEDGSKMTLAVSFLAFKRVRDSFERFGW